MPSDLANMSDELFETFINAQTFKTILHSFDELCRSVRIDRKTVGYGKRSLYRLLTNKLPSWKSKSLWTKIDKRGALKEYENGNACADMKVCIVGAGPVGLRLAIECALLGARCIVVEKRDRFSRHNVLHLWPYVITDLRNLGAKVFYGKFATGQIDHISIRQLQCILLKIALVLGVEIYPNVTFIDAIEPKTSQQGWRADFKPENHPILSTYEFSVLIGADGRRNSLQGFQHKEFRGKLAIGITCNYVNHHTREEQNFEEISGVAKIYNPQFFNELQQQTSIDLENIVYYKNDTHYFVMTAKKQSLLDKNVILQDFPDAARLLARDNVNFMQLCNFAREAAKFSTKCSPQFIFDFAEDHHGAADVQMFDFTSLFHAVNASRIVERNGKQIFMALVGDSLLESFWPTGSGIGLGFFGLFDTAWAILKFSKHEHPLKVLVERESIYNLLSQSTPENTKSNHQLYSINPATRYHNLNSKSFTIDEIRDLYDSDSIPTIDMNNNNLTIKKVDQTLERHTKDCKQTTSSLTSSSNENDLERKLFQWCEKTIDSYNITINNNTQSLQNCLAFCAIVHHYRPDIIDFESFEADRPISNFQILFDLMQNHLSIQLATKLQNSLILSMKSSMEERIRQSSIVILQLLYAHFHEEQQSGTLSSTLQTSSKPTNETNSKNEMTNTHNINNAAIKVSALVAHYSHSDVSSPANSHPLIGLQSERAPTFCFYCKEKVSIQDWFVVEKNVLHVKCFKCDTCHLQLRKTNYQVLTEPHRGKISFHCKYHNLNKQKKGDDDKNAARLYFDKEKRLLSLDETAINRIQQIFPSRHLENTTAHERVTYSLEKELIDDDKDEIVYNGKPNTINGQDNDNDDDDDDDDDDDELDDDEQKLPRNDILSSSSAEEIAEEEDEVNGPSDNEDEEEEGNNQYDNSVLKLNKSKSHSATGISTRKHDKKTLAKQNQYLTIDSDHNQSKSSSSVDLSPSPTSPISQHLLISKKSDPITSLYFRAPCPICRGSTYDEASTIEIEKQYYHKACLHCYLCEKQLKENEFAYHDLSSDGRYNFYCTLHYCKSRLKQVTTSLAVATQQESKSKTIYPNNDQLQSNMTIKSNNVVHLYPSLKDALSTKSHPLNVVHISNNKKSKHIYGSEHSHSLNLNNINDICSSKFTRSKTFEESLSEQLSDNDENLNVNSKNAIDNSGKHRFKRRGHNRTSSPIPTNHNLSILTSNSKQNETNIESIVKHKKKKILVPQLNLSSSSSRTSSQSFDDERQHASNERRRQREERQKELVRFRRSQEIQRELEEIEQKRLELDKRHMTARQNLCSSLNDETNKLFWERDCLRIVRERTGLQRVEDELLMAKRGLTLENERARAENEYRQLINLPDERKTIKDKEREEQLITMIAKLVEAKNSLTTGLDQMRLRELQEDECLDHVFQIQGIEQQTTSFSIPQIVTDII